MLEKYFLAANSCQGFISFFEDAYSVNDDWRACIIKGGPGTGKSSFMRKIAAIGEKYGHSPILCPCSSDPDSLDAVIFEDKKIIIFDGTPPHTVEPKTFGICETIINLGEFLDSNKLMPQKREVLAANALNKHHHKICSSYLKAAGELILEEINREKAHINSIKLESFANKLCKKLFSEKSFEKGETTRLISGITPKGIITFNDSINAENIIKIYDEIGVVFFEIVTVILNAAKESGYKTVKLSNPFLPNNLIDGIFIPTINTTIIRECDYIKPASTARRINSKRFLFNDFNESPTAKLNKKLIKELLFEAINNLKLAKAAHDKLEKFYINAMDFDTLNSYCEAFALQLFK